jgi:hypothetical protein
VTESGLNDEEDRKVAAEMPAYLQAELVRRLRDTGLFARVINASETGIFGGDSRDHLRESFDDMARNVGKFLVRLNKREAPKKD